MCSGEMPLCFVPMRQLPKKSNFRPRAHCNPFSDVHVLMPLSSDSLDWSTYYSSDRSPEFLDLGCGYGKFLLFLARKFPEKNICGMEIRKKVAEYVNKKICAYRKNENTCSNAAVIHTNAMLFLPNFFQKHSLEKVFVLFPDPQFKKRKHKARIVSRQMAHVYSYLLRYGGKLYISTDIREFFDFMVHAMEINGSFTMLAKKECENDELYLPTYEGTDEAKRAALKSGRSYATIFRRDR